MTEAAAPPSDTLDNHAESSIIRALCIGPSGTGKTGMLASLVIAGYTLWILDYDNGLPILRNALREHYKEDPDAMLSALRRVHARTLRDPVRMRAGVPKLDKPTAWREAGEALGTWNADKLGPSDVIVIDTLSTMTQSAFNHGLNLNGRLNMKPHEADYGWMADSVFLFIDMLTNDDMHCNVIVNTHVRYLRGEEESVQDEKTGKESAAGSLMGLPEGKGQQIPRSIAKYFNTLISTRTMGSGVSAKRVISTKPFMGIEVKTSNPFTVKSQYPVETGLADLFHDILGHGPPSTSKDA